LSAPSYSAEGTPQQTNAIIAAVNKHQQQRHEGAGTFDIFQAIRRACQEALELAMRRASAPQNSLDEREIAFFIRPGSHRRWLLPEAVFFAFFCGFLGHGARSATPPRGS
jgi:hypothetical protein